MKQKILFIILFAIVSISGIHAQSQPVDPTNLTQNIDLTIDNLGNATMVLSMKMDASQWNEFVNSEYAKNQSLFRRDLEREMMWVLIDEININLDDKNREMKATMNVKNMASYSGDNHWTVKLGEKDLNITKISDICYLITNNIASDNGGVTQQLQKYFFPAGATNVRTDNDRYGNTIITYDLPIHEASKVSLAGISGLILIVLGGLWLLWILFGNKLLSKKNAPVTHDENPV